jgi:hypothetical protein
MSTFKFTSLKEFCLESLNSDRPSSRYSYENYKETNYRCDICDKVMVDDLVYCAVRFNPTCKDRMYINGMVCSEECFNMHILQNVSWVV